MSQLLLPHCPASRMSVRRSTTLILSYHYHVRGYAQSYAVLN